MRMIVDGCDGVGKTTYASRLANIYHCDVIHMTAKSPKNLRAYLHRLRNDNVIFDRFFISEVVYSKVFNRNTKIKEFEIRFLLFICKLLKYEIRILTQDDSVMLERLKRRNDESNEILNNVGRLNEEYVKFADKYNIKLVKVNETL